MTRSDTELEKTYFERQVTAKVNHGVGGAISMMTWEDIELVYRNTGLTQLEVADLFWNHTGRWSDVVMAVRSCAFARERAGQASYDVFRTRSILAEYELELIRRENHAKHQKESLQKLLKELVLQAHESREVAE